jgi:four helix bundle protein
MQDFRNLQVWEKGHRLALTVYEITAGFPRSEVYGLTSQIRRASVSVPANIAEGCGRWGIGETTHFYQIAMGSASEVEYYLLLSRDLGLLGNSTYERAHDDVTEVKRMLAALIRELRARRRPDT